MFRCAFLLFSLPGEKFKVFLFILIPTVFLMENTYKNYDQEQGKNQYKGVKLACPNRICPFIPKPPRQKVKEYGQRKGNA